MIKIIGILLLIINTSFAYAELEAKNVAIIANSNSKESLEIAQTYKKARNIPDANLITISVSDEENISREEYESRIVEPIRKAIKEQNIAKDIKVLTTIYGIPLKISAPSVTNTDKDIGVAAQEALAKSKIEIEEYIKRAQKLAGEKQDGFIEIQEDKIPIEFQNLINRILSTLPQLSAEKSDNIQKELADIITNLGGLSTLITILKPAGSPEEQKKSADEIQKMHQDILNGAALISKLEKSNNKDDFQTRINTAKRIFGTLGVATIAASIVNKTQYFEAEASVDSELTLLWWDKNSYPISSAIPNPYNYINIAQDKLDALGLPILMTSRIDGPNLESCLSIINGSIEAEKNGLRGKAYIDTRGLKSESTDALTTFDKGLKDLGWYLRDNTDLSVEIDIYTELLEDAKNAAVYIGWYQLRKFEGNYSFKPGAIAWHVASEEAVSLRNKDEKGWCKNLLERGAAVCIGATAEPYLESFPNPKQFMGLLLSGRYSLVESYFLTTRNISWRIVLIGDPLYKPFKTNKDIKSNDFGLTEFPITPSNLNLKNPLEAQVFLEDKKRNSTSID